MELVQQKMSGSAWILRFTNDELNAPRIIDLGGTETGETLLMNEPGGERITRRSLAVD